MSPKFIPRRAHFRWLASMMFLALGACRTLLAIDDLPASDAGSADAAESEVAADADADATAVDRAWAHWRVPADVQPRYEVSGGIARDAVSGLSWQRASGPPADWEDSAGYCEGLEFEGADDWRLPTRVELMSLLDYQRPIAGNPFSPVFLDPDEKCLWMVSGETTKKSHWLLQTYQGRLGISTHDDVLCVPRCVRGAPYDYERGAPPRYVVENGVVRDPMTKLEWQGHVIENAGRKVSFETARRSCSELRLLGHPDWRLPTVKELGTLIDERRAMPALDPRVAGEADVYWSSTLHDATERDAGTSTLAWRVSFTDGTVVPADDGVAFSAGIALVRCVRDY